MNHGKPQRLGFVGNPINIIIYLEVTDSFP
jgi:hypothetical protein